MGERPLLLFALAREANPFLELCRRHGVLLRPPRRGRAVLHTATADVDVKIFGAGLANAGLALDGEDPSEVIHVGVGGALSRELRRGDVVRANSVRRGDDALEIGAPPRSTFAMLQAARFVTSPDPVDAAGKLRLGAADAGDVVDMESHPVALACDSAGIPWTGVRVVGDEASDEIPAAVLEAWDGHRFRTWPIVRRAMFDFPLARELIRLDRQMRTATARLAHALQEALL